MERRDAHEFARGSCLTDGATGLVGIETEWFVFDPGRPARPVPPDRVASALGVDLAAGVPVLSAGSRITFEPGGQLELSGPPLPLPAALRATADDLADVRARLGAEGLAVAGLGTDPLRPAIRHITGGRYAAMEEYWAAGGHTGGKLMMCSTAALQVNLDAGPREGWAARWRLAHDVGPTLIAMFASSPVLAGRPTGQRSSRHRIWSELDPTRTRPVPVAAERGAEPGDQWARYLLDARLMLVRDADGRGHRPVRDASTFADWLAGEMPGTGDEPWAARPPTVEDLAYHATTVFPPVRPRGWLEIRYLDAQPGPSWPLAAIVTTALLDDPAAAAVAADACAPVAAAWDRAARCGLTDPELHRAATLCLAAARAAAPRLGVGGGLLTALDELAENVVERRRCPADALLDSWRTGGAERVLTDTAVREATCVAA